MIRSSIVLLLPLLAVALVLSVAPVHATAGFAEWEIYTPGGNLISHNDIWKDEHGTCLRSDAGASADDSEIYLSHLRRWRYYPGHVAGEHETGYFVFDEATREASEFGSEGELASALGALGLDRPETDWLSPADGWREAWFPFMVWRPCRALLEPTSESDPQFREAAARMYTEAECTRNLSAEQLELYRRTTWGRICVTWRNRDLPESEAYLLDFCARVLDDR